MKKKAAEPPTSLEWISQKLRSVRLARGLTLQAVADRIGSVHSRVSDNESGRYDIKVSTLLRTLDALNISAADFFADMPRLKEIGEGTRAKTRKS